VNRKYQAAILMTVAAFGAAALVRLASEQAIVAGAPLPALATWALVLGAGYVLNLAIEQHS
jgi:hypothetical protein